MASSTQAVLEHHIQAFAESLDAVMDDFTEASVLITDAATYRGLEQIRGMYGEMIGSLPEGFHDAVRIHRKEVAGEVAFLQWDAKPWFPFCVDSFVIRDGRIVCQTFAAFRGA